MRTGHLRAAFVAEVVAVEVGVTAEDVSAIVVVGVGRNGVTRRAGRRIGGNLRTVAEEGIGICLRRVEAQIRIDVDNSACCLCRIGQVIAVAIRGGIVCFCLILIVRPVDCAL